jgi:hypothetical protein
MLARPEPRAYLFQDRASLPRLQRRAAGPSSPAKPVRREYTGGAVDVAFWLGAWSDQPNVARTAVLVRQKKSAPSVVEKEHS